MTRLLMAFVFLILAILPGVKVEAQQYQNDALTLLSEMKEAGSDAAKMKAALDRHNVSKATQPSATLLTPPQVRTVPSVQQNEVKPPAPYQSRPTAASPPRTPVKPAEAAKSEQRPTETRAAYAPPSPAPSARPTPNVAPARPTETSSVAPANPGSGEVTLYVKIPIPNEDVKFKFNGSGKEVEIKKGQQKYAVAKFIHGRPVGSPELLDRIPLGAKPVPYPQQSGG